MEGADTMLIWCISSYFEGEELVGERGRFRVK